MTIWNKNRNKSVRDALAIYTIYIAIYTMYLLLINHTYPIFNPMVVHTTIGPHKQLEGRTTDI